ncbi:DUF2523 family protein [Dokdonella soli]|uniref:DUF2523 domain-containing protein n=1 Tax=Dokdonella soli TaxID=529810 RepID=A0ABN1IDT5_9GAMM
MPVLIAALVGALWNLARAVLPGIVGKILITLGLTFATTKLVLPDLIAFLQSHMGGVSGDVLALLGYLNVDKAMVMIISAGVARTAGKAVLSAKAAP